MGTVPTIVFYTLAGLSGFFLIGSIAITIILMVCDKKDFDNCKKNIKDNKEQ